MMKRLDYQPAGKKLAEAVWTLADCLSNWKVVPRTLLRNGKRVFRELQASQQVTGSTSDEQVTLTSRARLRQRAQEATLNSTISSLRQPARRQQRTDHRHESRVTTCLQDISVDAVSLQSQLVLHQVCDDLAQHRDTSVHTYIGTTVIARPPGCKTCV